MKLTHFWNILFSYSASSGISCTRFPPLYARVSLLVFNELGEHSVVSFTKSDRSKKVKKSSGSEEGGERVSGRDEGGEVGERDE